MARKATADLERDMTTTRIYTEDIRVLKVLAEVQGINLVDYISVLTKDAVRRDGAKVAAALARYTALAAELEDAAGDVGGKTASKRAK